MSNGNPPPVPGTAPAKKSGLSPLAWIAIGCGGLIVVVLVAFMALGVFVFNKGKQMAKEVTGSDSFQEMVQNLEDNPARTMAETAIRVNPDLTLMSTDDKAGTITFRNDKTGEEATLNFEDIAQGRFSMTTDEGEFSVDASDAGKGGVTFKGPEGETRFGSSADLGDVPDWVPLYPGAGAGEAQGTFHSSSPQGTMGAFTFKTSDPPQTVVDHYEKVFEDGGYKVLVKSMNTTPQGSMGVLSGELAGEGRTLNVTATEQSGEYQVVINYSEKKQ